MTVRGYRCAGCDNYRLRPEYRRFGLGSVCSSECFEAARFRRSQGRRPPAADDVPPGTRNLVYERDGKRCRFCGDTNQLHQHHISYRSEGVDHSPTNLITLCREHHELVHSDKRRWQPVCRTYIAETLQGRRRFLVELDREINERRAADP